MIQAQMDEAAADDARMRRRREALAWALVVAWAAVIFAMSAKTAHEFEMGEGIVAQVKMWLTVIVSGIAGHRVDVSPIGHFAEYLVFGGLLVNALRLRLPPGKAALGAVAIVAVYAVTDEFHQMFVPGRACDPADWAVDITAAAIAALVGWLLLRRVDRKEKAAVF